MKSLEIAHYVRRCLEKGGAIWMYKGPPRKEAPHALLTSGQHSNGYVDVGSYLKGHPTEREEMASLMLEQIPGDWRDGLDAVVGADTSSTDLAKDIANLAGIRHIVMLKTENEQGKAQTWSPENQLLKDGELVLQVEELVTTAVSALMVRQGIRKVNPGVAFKFAPLLPVIVDRSDPLRGVEAVEDSRILSLLRLRISNFDPGPSSCPFCQAGSEAIKPKEGTNWQRLVAA